MQRTLMGVAWLAAAMLVGCATTPETQPAVEQARSEIENARTDANAQRYSNDEIRRAEGYLANAESAVDEGKDRALIEHYAYLAAQTARLAREVGRARSAEDRFAAASSERDRIRLEARTREAEQARREAQAAAGAAAEAQRQAEQRGTELANLQAEMQQLQAQQSSRGLVVTLGDMLFDTGRAELKSGADRQLATIVAFLQQHPERHVLIEGFTDSVGGDELNQRLSEQRAEAVRSALVSRGIDAGRIETAGYGEQFPVGSNRDAGGRQLNRRVEVVLSTGSNPVQRR